MLLFIMSYLIFGIGEFGSKNSEKQAESFPEDFQFHKTDSGCNLSKNSSLNLGNSSYKKCKLHRKRNFIKKMKQYFKTTSWTTCSCTPFFIHCLRSTTEKYIPDFVLMKAQSIANAGQKNTKTPHDLEKSVDKPRGKFRNFFFPKAITTTLTPISDTASLNSSNVLDLAPTSKTDYVSSYGTNYTSSIPSNKISKLFKKNHYFQKISNTVSNQTVNIDQSFSTERSNNDETVGVKTAQSLEEQTKTSTLNRFPPETLQTEGHFFNFFMKKKSSTTKLDKTPEPNVDTVFDYLSSEKHAIESHSNSFTTLECQICLDKDNTPFQELKIKDNYTSNSKNFMNKIFNFNKKKTTREDDQTVGETTACNDTISYTTTDRLQTNNLNEWENNKFNKNKSDIKTQINIDNSMTSTSTVHDFSTYTKIRLRDILNFRKPTSKNSISGELWTSALNSDRLHKSVHTECVTVGNYSPKSRKVKTKVNLKYQTTDMVETSTIKIPDECEDISVLFSDRVQKYFSFLSHNTSTEQNELVENKTETCLTNTSSIQGNVCYYSAHRNTNFQNNRSKYKTDHAFTPTTQDHNACSKSTTLNCLSSNYLVGNLTNSNILNPSVTFGIKNTSTINFTYRKFQFKDIFHFGKTTPTYDETTGLKSSLLLGSTYESAFESKNITKITSRKNGVTNIIRSTESEPFHLKNIFHKQTLKPSSAEDDLFEEDISTSSAVTQAKHILETQIPATPHFNGSNIEPSNLNSGQEAENELFNSTNANVIHFKNMFRFRKPASRQLRDSFLLTSEYVMSPTISSANTVPNPVDTAGADESSPHSIVSTTHRNVHMKNIFNFRKPITTKDTYNETKFVSYYQETTPSTSKILFSVDNSNQNTEKDYEIKENTTSQNKKTAIANNYVTAPRRPRLGNIFSFHKSISSSKTNASTEFESGGNTVYTTANKKENTQQIDNTMTTIDQCEDCDTVQSDKSSSKKVTQTHSPFFLKKIINFHKRREEETKENEYYATSEMLPMQSEDYFKNEFNNESATENSPKETYGYWKTEKDFDRWMLRTQQKDKSAFYFDSKCKPNRFVETGEGNLFKWCTRTIPDITITKTNQTLSSVNVSSSKTQTVIHNNSRTTVKFSVAKKKYQNLFNFMSLTKYTAKNNTTIKTEHNITTEPVNKCTTTQNCGTTPKTIFHNKILKRTKKKFITGNKVRLRSKNRNKIYSPVNTYRSNKTRKIYKPFEKFPNPSTWSPTINISEFNAKNITEFDMQNINCIIQNMTRKTNSTLIFYPEYVHYLASLKNSTKFKNCQLNKTLLSNTTLYEGPSFSIMTYVMKPLEKLVSVFRATPSNLTLLGNVNSSDIKNGSFPEHLHPPKSSVVFVTSGNKTGDSPDETHLSMGFLNILGGWFSCLLDPYIEPKSKDIHFYLYTRNNSDTPEELFLGEEARLEDNSTEVPEPVFEKEDFSCKVNRKRQSDEDFDFEPLNPAKTCVQSKWFNVLKDTKVLVHGYLEDSRTDIMVKMKDAYLKKSPFNVILVDWSVVSDDPCYLHSTKAVSVVGSVVARLLDTLVEGGVSLTRVHMVGFSLGAHVAGHAGTNISHGLLHRITGLDPALPLVPMDSEVSLDNGDAVFVDVIHSAMGYLGQPGPSGHVDFYPNGGSQQPGCDGVTFSLCSHRRAAVYFIESILSPVGFYATLCDSWPHFQAGQCNGSATLLMGDPCPTNATGKYYLATGQKEPFAQPPEGHVKVKKSLFFDLFYDYV